MKIRLVVSLMGDAGSISNGMPYDAGSISNGMPYDAGSVSSGRTRLVLPVIQVQLLMEG